ncbi:MAG TPA: Uma2 family endonuclease [Plasticicumulans sp.]|nr:Uma2 family endonuclease [Plasticicumulans sp.]
MNAVVCPRLTVADYLAGERDAELRHEYENGFVRAMTGTSRAHNSIAMNVAAVLHSHLRGSPCRVHVSDVKVHVDLADDQRFYYPDVLVDCGSGGDAYVASAPKLVVEVLSASTERRDRAEKAQGYRRLPTLAEYVLIAQDVRRVEVYRRSEGWEFERTIDSAATPVRFESLGLELTLDAIYEGLELPADPGDSPKPAHGSPDSAG